MDGSTSLSLLHSSLDTHLYITMQQEMGLKSEAIVGWFTFGNTTSLVALMELGIWPILKKSLTVAEIIGPIMVHACLKKLLLYPLGPGDLRFEIEKMASWMS